MPGIKKIHKAAAAAVVWGEQQTQYGPSLTGVCPTEIINQKKWWERKSWEKRCSSVKNTADQLQVYSIGILCR